MGKMGVYCLICEDLQVIYIGSSVYDVHKRHSNHLALLRKGIHYKKELQDIYYTFGEYAIKFAIIEECPVDEISMAEETWINYYEEKGWHVLNKQDVFKGRKKHDKEARRKMSERQRGSRNGNARLNEDQVREIKRLLDEKVKHQTIADQFGVSTGQISNIASGLRWKHVV